MTIHPRGEAPPYITRPATTAWERAESTERREARIRAATVLAWALASFLAALAAQAYFGGRP